MTLKSLSLNFDSDRRSRSPWQRLKRAFTLVELLLVVAIVSILAAMVISHFSDAAQGARNVVAMQQLASWQNAVHNWVNSKTGRIDPAIDANGAPLSLETLRLHYNNKTRRERFVLLAGKDLNGTASADGPGYLEAMTADHFINTINSRGTGANTSKIISGALMQTNQWLELPAWTATSYPQVQIFGLATRTPPADTDKS